jgi:hypothetical protein
MKTQTKIRAGGDSGGAMDPNGGGGRMKIRTQLRAGGDGGGAMDPNDGGGG